MRPCASIVRSASSASITPVRASSVSSSSPTEQLDRLIAQLVHEPAEGAHRARGGGRARPAPSGSSSASQSERPLKPGGGGQPIDARIADAAAGLVDDAPQRDLVGRVVEHAAGTPSRP